MQVVTYDTIRKFVEKEVGMPLNVDIFWGTTTQFVYPPKMERVYFRLFKNLALKSYKGKYHKKDNGHTLTPDMVPKIVHHFQKMGTFPLGAVKVIP